MGKSTGMSPRQRMEWIAKYIAGQATGVEVLDSTFVDAYIEATNARFYEQAWGAHKCPQLGRDLSAMHKAGKLKRFRIGLGGSWQPGFPTWVWSYEIATT